MVDEPDGVAPVLRAVGSVDLVTQLVLLDEENVLLHAAGIDANSATWGAHVTGEEYGAAPAVDG